MGYPLRMPTALLLRHPQVEEATRCRTTRQQDETRQVLVSVRGPLSPHIDLGNWGLFYLRPYTPEPLRCFRCQRYGHHKDNCSRAVTCGICSGRHWTEKCLTLYKEKKEVHHRCANCGAAHHAWNPACPVRLQRVNQDRERQVNWVKEQQSASTTPAPPGTFVWGQQRNTSPPTPQQREIHQGPCDTLQNFSPLTNTPATLTPQANHPPPSASRQTSATNGNSQTSPPVSVAPTSSPTPMPVPSTTQMTLPPGSFIMTADLLQNMVKELTLMSATAFQHVTGVTVDMAAFELVVDKMTKKITDQVIEKTQALTHQQHQRGTPTAPLTTLLPQEVPPMTHPSPKPRRADPRMRPVTPTPSVSGEQTSCASANGTAGGSVPNTRPSLKCATGKILTYSSFRRRSSQ